MELDQQNHVKLNRMEKQIKKINENLININCQMKDLCESIKRNGSYRDRSKSRSGLEEEEEAGTTHNAQAIKNDETIQIKIFIDKGKPSQSLVAEQKRESLQIRQTLKRPANSPNRSLSSNKRRGLDVSICKGSSTVDGTSSNSILKSNNIIEEVESALVTDDINSRSSEDKERRKKQKKQKKKDRKDRQKSEIDEEKIEEVSMGKQDQSLLVDYLNTPQMQSLMKMKVAQFEKKEAKPEVHETSLFDDNTVISSPLQSVANSDINDEANESTAPKRKRNRRKNKNKKSEVAIEKVSNKQKDPPNYSLKLPKDQLPKNSRFIFNDSEEDEENLIKPRANPETNGQPSLKNEQKQNSLPGTESKPPVKSDTSNLPFKPKEKNWKNDRRSVAGLLESMRSTDSAQGEPQASLKPQRYGKNQSSNQSGHEEAKSLFIKPVKSDTSSHLFKPKENDTRSIACFLESMRNTDSTQGEPQVSPNAQRYGKNQSSHQSCHEENKSLFIKPNPPIIQGNGDASHTTKGPVKLETKNTHAQTHNGINNGRDSTTPMSQGQTEMSYKSSATLEQGQLLFKQLGASIDPTAKFAELMTKQKRRNNRGRNDGMDDTLDYQMHPVKEQAVPSQQISRESTPSLPNTAPPTSRVMTRPQIEALLPVKGNPSLGDFIAFKMMEMDESFCPGLSAFKVGKVISFESEEISIEVLPQYKNAAPKTGRFAMDWDDDSEEDVVTSVFSLLHDVRQIPQ